MYKAIVSIQGYYKWWEPNADDLKGPTKAVKKMIQGQWFGLGWLEQENNDNKYDKSNSRMMPRSTSARQVQNFRVDKRKTTAKGVRQYQWKWWQGKTYYSVTNDGTIPRMRQGCRQSWGNLS